MSDRFNILAGMLQKKFKNKPVFIGIGSESFNKVSINGFIDTGSVGYNIDLGGGFARGRIHEIYGNEGSGKTTLSLEAIKTEQLKGNKCAFIDVERSLNTDYLSAIGINPDELLLVQTETAEEAWTAVEMIAASKEVSLIVLDSLAGLVPELVWEKGIENDTRARLASVNTKALTMINPRLTETDTTLILINQVRAGQDLYGPSETTPGGNIIKFLASSRTRIRRKSYEKTGTDFPIGQISEYQIIKNKISAPGKSGTIRILFGKGIDKVFDLVDVALNNSLSGLEVSGSWIKFEGKTIVQGRDKLIALLEEDLELKDKITKNLMEKKDESVDKKTDGNREDSVN